MSLWRPIVSQQIVLEVKQKLRSLTVNLNKQRAKENTTLLELDVSYKAYCSFLCLIYCKLRFNKEFVIIVLANITTLTLSWRRRKYPIGHLSADFK